ncbi:MAG: hypothetical protein AVDCRST_MAG19-218, partial [uncultured Thermomicrobiales bacterium]
VLAPLCMPPPASPWPRLPSPPAGRPHHRPLRRLLRPRRVCQPPHPPLGV